MTRSTDQGPTGSPSLVHALDATTVTITVAVSEASIRVDVRDDGALGVPHMRPGDPEAEDGRGFLLINQLARRWGFTREPAGSCCWAGLPACGCGCSVVLGWDVTDYV